MYHGNAAAADVPFLVDDASINPSKKRTEDSHQYIFIMTIRNRPAYKKKKLFVSNFEKNFMKLGRADCKDTTLSQQWQWYNLLYIYIYVMLAENGFRGNRCR